MRLAPGLSGSGAGLHPPLQVQGAAGLPQDLRPPGAQCVHDHLAGRYDLITWVPLSDKRKKERGYDQAFLLSSAAALELDDVAVETLRKGRNTQAQSGLDDDAARRANVLGAYTIVDPELVEGKRVLLIDDVITTGSTISECARVLRSAGAADVVCATLARARGEKT